jgi:alkaline phosphatase D
MQPPTHLLLGIFLLLSPLGACQEALSPAPYQDSWAASPDRPWPGKDWVANRVQDWRIRSGRLECMTGQDRSAGRTAHLLVREVMRGFTGKVHLGVDIEAMDPGPLRERACAGFLFGVGNPGNDPRTGAMVQQVPAPGGGLLASVDADGKLTLRDFSQDLEKAGSWVLPGNVDFGSLPLLAESNQTIPTDAWPLRLTMDFVDEGGLTLTALQGMKVMARLALADLPRDRVAGGVALFSARGPEKSKRGFAFSKFSLEGAHGFPERAFGPVLGVLYTVGTDMDGERALRFSAQLPVLGPEENPILELKLGGAPSLPGILSTDGSWTCRWVLPGWEFKEAVSWTLTYEAKEVLKGSIRGEPGPDDAWSLAVLSCVKHQVGRVRWDSLGLWFPHADLVERLSTHDPDLLYFAGDQLYEGDITGTDRRSPEIAIMDYHTRWQRFLWAFGDLTLSRPAVVVPDDHDVFHGNLWGAGGIRARGPGGHDAGGYKMPAAFLKVVHGTQTGNLPPTRVSPVIGQGVTTWSTAFSWGGVDFCVLSDRMWKSSPATAVPAGKFRNGWSQVDGFDPRDADVLGAVLLGEEQEALLEEWGSRTPPGTWTKIVLSQSPFACLHTLPGRPKSDRMVTSLVVPKPGEYPPNDHPVMDGDSNGWPQAARNRAVRLLARAGALHLAGDQHLGTVAWYGSEAFRDGTVAFTSPAMGNTFPRRWMPVEEGMNRKPGAPAWTGDFHEGFGNKVTVLAVANPVDEGRKPELLFNRAPGYGIVRLNPGKKTVHLEAWPRWADPADPAQMFPGWPLVLGPDGRPLPD